MKIVSFGSFVFPEYEGVQTTPLLINNNVVTLATGGIDLSGNNLSLGPRQFSMQFLIAKPETNGPNDAILRTMLVELNKGINLLKILSDDNIEYYGYAKLNSFSTSIVSSNSCQLSVNLIFDVFYPYLWPVTETVNFLDTGLLLDGSFDLDHGIGWTVISGNVNTPINFSITVPSGSNSLENLFLFLDVQRSIVPQNARFGFTLTNNTNGYKITAISPVNENETAYKTEVYTGTKTALGETVVTVPTNQYKWFRLEPGINDLTFIRVFGDIADWQLSIYHPSEILI